MSTNFISSFYYDNKKCCFLQNSTMWHCAISYNEQDFILAWFLLYVTLKNNEECMIAIIKPKVVCFLCYALTIKAMRHVLIFKEQNIKDPKASIRGKWIKSQYTVALTTI